LTSEANEDWSVKLVVKSPQRLVAEAILLQNMKCLWLNVVDKVSGGGCRLWVLKTPRRDSNSYITLSVKLLMKQVVKLATVSHLPSVACSYVKEAFCLL
jgi:hypothetical protein